MAAEENVVNIGKKSVADYVLEIILKFNETDEVVIRGRGAATAKAVDVYNALKTRLGDSLQLVSVKIDSEEVFDKSGKRRMIPVIEIKVRRTI